jgi:RnfABCDGE-type electron transport complex D subunit
MKIIRNILDNLNQRVEKGKALKKFKPVMKAADDFFFGTDKVASLPHISDHLDLKRYMSLVIVALLPVTLAAIYFWGLRVIAIILVSYIFGSLVEVAFAVVRKKEIHEGFLVTGLIFPLILPPTVPLWIVAVGVMFAGTFGKEVFGGTGRNIFNPAIVGRVFLSIAFPQIMTTSWQMPYRQGWGGLLHYKVDALTTATPLANFRNERILANIAELFWGNIPGCLGETFKLAIILGGLFLILTRISNWRIPLAYLLSVVIFSFLGNHFNPGKFAPPLFQIFSGGLLFGAMFMVTDPVTSPFTRAGKWIGGVLLGFLTVLIRSLSGYVEGVMFSILLMNAFAPLIDHIVLGIRYKKTKVR